MKFFSIVPALLCTSPSGNIYSATFTIMNVMRSIVLYAISSTFNGNKWSK